MPSFKQVLVDGRLVLLPCDPPAPEPNPPLAMLNDNYREADAERRDEVDSTIKAASSAMKSALLGRDGRRVQRNLRPPPARA